MSEKLDWQEKLYRRVGWSEEKQSATRRKGIALFIRINSLIEFFYGFCVFFLVASSLIFLWYGLSQLALLYLSYGVVYGLIGYLMRLFCQQLLKLLRLAERTHRFEAALSINNFEAGL